MIPLLAVTDTFEIGPLVMGLLGGLALFLFGMDQMTRGLRLVAGARMRKFLSRLTTNPLKGAFAGAVTTAVIQSSSVTTVLVIGFVSAGLMTLSQAIGVVMGANIGTTITAQIVAFKVTHYALFLVAGGFAWQLIRGERRSAFYGLMVMGLGLLFYGMELMSEATRPLRDYAPFIEFMRRMDQPLLGILAGTAVTAAIQSSSATTVMVIVLAGQGYVTLEAGIYLVFGSNLGTCVTALLGSIGKPRVALQAAMAHVTFNVVGVALWYAFVPQLGELVRWLSPVHPELEGAARLAAESPRQIANAHTVFNLTNAFVLIGFTGPLAWLIRKLVPEQVGDEQLQGEVKYLDDLYLESAPTALDLTRLELSRLGAGTLRFLHGSLSKVLYGSREDLEELRREDDEIDALHGAIVSYLGRLSQGDLATEDAWRLREYLAAANHFESIGDMVETDFCEAGEQRLRLGVTVSEGTAAQLTELHRKVCWAVDSVVRALVDRDPAAAREVVEAKIEINRLADAANDHLVRRLGASEPDRMKIFRIESDLIENLKRIYYFAKRIARVVTTEPATMTTTATTANANADPEGELVTLES
ncbi:MAG: Na/Pi cotransporter family protein [Verrucomicrobiae bacterium]|nr:Na/Pi cotransporter family protein [Verrucomicrobiae bacterium]